MANPKVEVLIKNCCETIGEGPHWDVPSQSLWYVDILKGGIGNWNAETGKVERFDLDGTVGFVTPRDKGGVIAGLAHNIVSVDLNTKETTVLATVEGGEQSRFNDAKCDASGRLWAGTLGLKNEVPAVVDHGKGSLYSLGSDGKITKQIENIDVSNGMDWTEDNSVMYFIDSIPRKIFAYDFDITQGTISNQRTVVEFEHDSKPTHGFPDGMCVDSEGKIWVACFSASRVYRYDPETGKALQYIEFPVTNVTSVAFGGKHLDELFVTSGAYNVENLESQPLAGSIFRVTELGVKGRPMYNYKY